MCPKQGAETSRGGLHQARHEEKKDALSRVEVKIGSERKLAHDDGAEGHVIGAIVAIT